MIMIFHFSIREFSPLGYLLLYDIYFLPFVDRNIFFYFQIPSVKKLWKKRTNINNIKIPFQKHCSEKCKKKTVGIVVQQQTWQFISHCVEIIVGMSELQCVNLYIFYHVICLFFISLYFLYWRNGKNVKTTNEITQSLE